MNEFFNTVGKVALGTRLRKLGDQLMEEASQIYDLYDVPLQAKWFPVYYTMAQQKDCSITQIATIIGHTHPSVSKIIKEMDAAGLINYNKKSKDGRFTTVNLNDKAMALLPNLIEQLEDARDAIEEVLDKTTHNIWLAMEDMEFELDNKSFYKRVLEKRKIRLAQEIKIIDFSTEHSERFKELNLEWIEKYFTVEPLDEASLNKPKKKIIKPGGHIYMAEYKGVVIGTCALIKFNDTTYELSKMAVTEAAQGLNVGYALGKAIIKKAKNLGANKIYLESNTQLKPAINLYQKLGFTKVVGIPSPYERSNIRMELNF